MARLIATWKSRSGKYWVTLELGPYGYEYRADSSGGSIRADDDAGAIAQVQAKVDAGYFQPDSAKTPMRREMAITCGVCGEAKPRADSGQNMCNVCWDAHKARLAGVSE